MPDFKINYKEVLLLYCVYYDPGACFETAPIFKKINENTVSLILIAYAGSCTGFNRYMDRHY